MCQALLVSRMVAVLKNLKKESVFSHNSFSQRKGRSQLNRTANIRKLDSFIPCSVPIRLGDIIAGVVYYRGSRLKRERVGDQIHSTVPKDFTKMNVTVTSPVYPVSPLKKRIT